MEIETKEQKSDSVSSRSAALSLLVIDDEDSTRNLCRDVAAEAGLDITVLRQRKRRFAFSTSIPWTLS